MPYLLALLAFSLALTVGAPVASAAAPGLGDAWAWQVFTSSARLSAEVNPNAEATTYRFDYITQSAYAANLAGGKDPFAGSLRSPAGADASAGSGSASLTVTQLLFNLQVDTSYRYRVVAKNADGTSIGATQGFATQSISTGALLPDNRGWEMVSPLDKNGGQVDPPGALAGGGVLQAAAQGDAVTYGSAASFAGGQGAPPASQYIATRTAGGWSTLNITAPLFSGSYDTSKGGVPYRLFSEDLQRAVLLNGHLCRGEAMGCAVANPPLAGTDAVAGYQNYYLRSGAGFEALLGPAEVNELAEGPAEFELGFAGAAPDLGHVVLSTCGALSADATDGCGADAPNLYLWSAAGGLSLINATPGAALGAQSGAISADGSRVYWSDLASGDLYLREGTQIAQADQDAGGGGTFETASADGSIAYFTNGGHLWRYLAATGSATDLTPSGGVVGVLGPSANGSAIYYLDAGGLRLWQGATSTVVPGALAADASNYPPTTGTARVSADGTKLLFVSSQSLTGYDNTDLNTKAADSQVYLYDADTDALNCLSCNPTGGRPIGPSSVPGAIANGTAPGSLHSYKPRALAADGRRAFFESKDALVATDTNNDTDVYQWEAQGEGSCTRASGCVALLSSGRATGGATFVDASADGSDAFFLTDDPLVKADPGSLDLYVARIGGGFPEPPAPIPCQGDACQALPPEPTDPTLTTVLAGPGNPPVRLRTYGQRRKKSCRGKGKRRGGCAGKRGKAKPGGEERR